MTPDPVEVPNTCRLCNGQVRFFGERKILGNKVISYFECDECKSLQTEQPYWLEEAYRPRGTGLDVGACQRCFDLAMQVSALFAILGVGKDNLCLDYGAGMGMFSRLMRDRGYDFYAYDKYQVPFYMDKFLSSLEEKPWSLVTAFEVFEHLVNPQTELPPLFRAVHDMVLCTTEFWTGQGLDWWYIAATAGQHVFFFSPASFQLVARANGFQLIDAGLIKLFMRDELYERYMIDPPVLAAAQDPGTRSRLGLELFLAHQKDPYPLIQKDLAKLVLAEELRQEELRLEQIRQEELRKQQLAAEAAAPLWRKIARWLKRRI